MLLRKPVLLVVGLLASTLHAQMLLEDMADSDLGRPVQPPFITLLGIVSPGRMATDPSQQPVSAAAAVAFEEIRVNVDGVVIPVEVMKSAQTRYDEQERPTEVVYVEAGATTTTITKYDGPHIISRETSFVRPQGQPGPKAWSYWKYDPSGKLSEFRRGRGDALENHYLNFAHDNQGRLTGFEYHQGAKDELSTRSEYAYSSDGKSVTRTQYDKDGAFLDSLNENLNGQGKINDATIVERDWQTKKPKPAIKVTFSYDQQGRLIRQDTDPYAFDGGDEQTLPPGRVLLAYDDEKHSRNISYSSKEGSLSSTIMLDPAGATIGLVVQGGIRTAIGMKLECTYDSHGNWTQCRRLVDTAGSLRLTAAWRRAIEYR